MKLTLQRAEIIETRLKAIIKRFKNHKLSSRGLGMIWGLDVAKGAIAKDIIKGCFNAGLLIESSGADDEVIKIMAALTIEPITLDKGFDILEDVLSEVLAESKLLS